MDNDRRLINDDEDRRAVELFVPLVDFLGSVLGGDVEVVLHDCRNPEESVIAICNGHLSGRSVGTPMTNLLLKIMQRNTGEDSLVKYYAKSQTGQDFYSSTYFIRNGRKEIIGALCINIDVGRYRDLFNMLGERFGFFGGQGGAAEHAGYKEILSGNAADVINDLMADAMKKNGFAPGNMSVEEKERFVETLFDAGAFIYKGSVPQVARFLRISEPTVYRHISKAKKRERDIP